MTVATATDDSGKLAGFKLIIKALGQRKTGMMFIFGFSAGLPYSLLLGTLYAWLSDAEVDLETMGVFSLIGLAYAFKFLWSPVVDRLRIPVVSRLGRRKAWLIPAQLILGGIFLALSALDPKSALGWFSLLAGIGAFASATQDVAIDAWRVDIADAVSTVDLLSTVYQLGYRIAALVGGALVLFLADIYDWPFVYALMGGVMLFIAVISLSAPDTDAPIVRDEDDELQQAGVVNPNIRTAALCAVAVFWGWALFTVIRFMVLSLGADPELRPDSIAFITIQGPIIVTATVIIPSIIAAILEFFRNTGRFTSDAAISSRTATQRVLDHGYRALILPLTDIIGRLGWATILVITLILSYRITDNIWGTFAYPFYLGELEYTKSEVAVASKFFGVGMTMAGIALGGILFATVGRMATLTIGAITAAASNLLYAQLAAGGALIDIVARFSGFTWLLSQFGQDERMARLMLAITGENLAGGLAGAAFVAYLSSIASKQYSAVQYALLSSLTFLVGTVGRGALGKMIEDQGYYEVFIFCAYLGLGAIVLCLFEWARTAHNMRKAKATIAN